jgi:hypothetical protein
MKLRLYVTVLGAVLAVAGCSSEEDGDETGTGGTGNEGGTGVGATGGTGVGATGGTGVGGTGSGGEGGGGTDCRTCAEYLNECILEAGADCETVPFCEGGSEDVYGALVTCICTDCADECGGSMCENIDMEGCGECQMTSSTSTCNTEFQNCANDA